MTNEEVKRIFPFSKIISLSIFSSERIFYQVVDIPTFRWITCYKWSGHQDLRRRYSENMIFLRLTKMITHF